MNALNWTSIDSCYRINKKSHHCFHYAHFAKRCIKHYVVSCQAYGQGKQIEGLSEVCHTAFQRCLVSHAYKPKPNYLSAYLFIHLGYKTFYLGSLKSTGALQSYELVLADFGMAYTKELQSCSLLPGLPDILGHCINIGLQGWGGYLTRIIRIC